ncbi:hypothetical protein [Zavarzinella formosa]|uniref:hypothetical protein n=1 Tax=Zavarzinella formosa TaxID=360055 RepID=UPI000307D86E|nr:hypothetical protein [Zavarzinella formosa]
MDIRARIQAIREADPNFWRDPRTLEVAKLAWGAECHVNPHGVFSPCPKEIVARCGKAVAEVGICRVRDGIFVFCTRLQTGNYGYSYAPSVWVDEPYATEEEARRAGIRELIEGTVAKPGLSKAENAELSVLRARLMGQIRQPTLF